MDSSQSIHTPKPHSHAAPIPDSCPAPETEKLENCRLQRFALGIFGVFYRPPFLSVCRDVSMLQQPSAIVLPLPAVAINPASWRLRGTLLIRHPGLPHASSRRGKNKLRRRRRRRGSRALVPPSLARIESSSGLAYNTFMSYGVDRIKQCAPFTREFMDACWACHSDCRSVSNVATILLLPEIGFSTVAGLPDHS